MVPTSGNYGIAGSPRQSTSPNAPRPVPTTTGIPFGTVGSIPGQIGAGQYSGGSSVLPWQQMQSQAEQSRGMNRQRAASARRLGSSLGSIVGGYAGQVIRNPGQSVVDMTWTGSASPPIPPAAGSPGGYPDQVIRNPDQPVVDAPWQGSAAPGGTGYTSTTWRKMQEEKAANEAAAAAAEEERLRRLREIYGSLGALTPEQQMAYRQSVRDAEREFEIMRNQVQVGRRGARRDYRQGVRQVNRQQAGGSQDLATALAYLGLDTSPATMGVGLQDIERQSDIARSGLAGSKAEQLAILDNQLSQALIQRNRQRSAAEQARLNARAQASLRAQQFAINNPELRL